MRLLLACQPRVGLLATRERVPWVKQCQLITFLILLQLVSYIIFYCCSVFPYSIHIVSLAPKLAVSVCKFHIPILLENHYTAFSFQISHESRNAHFGRDTQQQMDVIRTYFSFYDIHTLPLTQSSNNISYILSLFLKEYLSSVLWCKHHMIFAIPLCVC